MDPKDKDEMLSRPRVRQRLQAVARSLNVEMIEKASREKMLESIFSALARDGLIAMHVFDVLREACGECVREPETGQKLAVCPRCAVISKTQGVLTEGAAAIAAGVARWNALHPDQAPIGHPDRLAAINEAMKEGSN